MHLKESSPVLADHDGTVLRLTLNRPDRLNAVSEELYAALLAHLAKAESEKRTRCILLEGTGRAFCAGADLKAHGSGTRTRRQCEDYVDLGQRVCGKLQRIGIPVVAAVHGYALGAGAEIAVSADFLVVAEDAQMGFPEVSLGTFVGGGVTYRLPRLAGLRRATELLILGERFTGRQALEWGLAYAAPSAEDLDRVAGELAAQLAAKAPISFAHMKRRLAETTNLSGSLRGEATDLLTVMRTRDWAAGVAAFADKREPTFHGD